MKYVNLTMQRMAESNEKLIILYEELIKKLQEEVDDSLYVGEGGVFGYYGKYIEADCIGGIKYEYEDKLNKLKEE
jgi:hypothetical protein